MILNLANCGSIQLGGTVYARLSHTWGGGGVSIQSTSGGLWHSSFAGPPPAPILKIDGLVYVRGDTLHAVANAETGESHIQMSSTGGGYIEPVTNTYVVEHWTRDKGTGGEDSTYHRDFASTVSFRSLAIVPHAFVGGLILDGISLPESGQTYSGTGKLPDGHWTQGRGTLEYTLANIATSFRINTSSDNRIPHKIHCDARSGYLYGSGSAPTRFYVYSGHANWIGTYDAWRFVFE
ncbi:MAG: hypothetical protein IJL06_07465 [Kiritimatiellae bacterium]|nr:hypothetical protein [Kiritimatiellia bacterium]